MPQIEVLSPLPGIFYRQAAPDAPPYVTEGSRVRVGDVLGLIEVMKQFSEVSAEVDGTVLRFAVGNGDAVEPGQTLLFIETP
ncbi:acetyl-CoA carboxylase [Verminephrobacter eiseniae]|uniref:acetyl-CoA carboxylase n=1 Tax=Verminephrobacter eiseniae TaxID=364317 RepID=UPI0010D0346F|nr:acetyl-CoA carboxylase [Verminephrobacter eiseniae]KAB7597627.1 biotin carboxyl carrier domain-containing protein [Verminephrobacter sp. Larva24]MCW5230286.1 biotin carboxyl carrier domain-containing protein [Verminephrobacter eiseniae]MCW5292020.1 biotin carboxyl carrier domain-containing protein [Verminephrobacter eiseniae]MCW8185772.1 biotin carboxyl carrier domain-containing protein [Verminephrobacter eiseniae]MCW8225311.1 biotin carboxyl carrier domain-containing protein [Verminephroba